MRIRLRGRRERRTWPGTFDEGVQQKDLDMYVLHREYVQNVHNRSIFIKMYTGCLN